MKRRDYGFKTTDYTDYTDYIFIHKNNPINPLNPLSKEKTIIKETMVLKQRITRITRIK